MTELPGVVPIIYLRFHLSVYPFVALSFVSGLPHLCLGFHVCSQDTLELCVCEEQEEERPFVALSGPGTLLPETLDVPLTLEQ